MHPTIRSWLFAITLLLLWLPACRPRRWTGEVTHVGAMRTVLAEGHTQGRVDLADIAGRRGVYALGALAGLDGEVTVLAGQVWLSRVGDNGAIMTERMNGHLPQATLLTSTHVPGWRPVAIGRDVPMDDLEDFIRHRAADAGIDTTRPFPFLVMGPVGNLTGHVVNGACPHATIAGAAPAIFELPTAPTAQLIGFFAEDAAGVMTHHGQRTHMHVFVQAAHPIAGHVDRVDLVADGVLCFPIPAHE